MSKLIVGQRMMSNMRDTAFIEGNKTSAVAVFIEDVNEDLVDVKFYCLYSDCIEGVDLTNAKWWPAYSFSPDYDTCCDSCGSPIHVVTSDEEEDEDE